MGTVVSTSGGQVSDVGCVVADGKECDILDAQVAAGYVLHHCQLAEGVTLKVGDTVTSRVNMELRRMIAPNHTFTHVLNFALSMELRRMIAPNHTFTHVLNFALREVLGDHIDQKGSVVMADKLRFDFSNNGAVDADKVEAIVCEQLAKQVDVFSREVALTQAKEINGLRAVFGEVYPDPVRVVSVGRSIDDLLANPKEESNKQHSIEFCGGTHLANTRDAKAFALISEEGIAKGVRRIVAFTMDEAVKAIAEGERLEAEIAKISDLPEAELGPAVGALKQDVDVAVIPAPKKATLRDQLATLQKKAELGPAVGALKQDVDVAVIPAAKKATLRDQLATLQMKAAANANKAMGQDVAAADTAVAEGKAFTVSYMVADASKAAANANKAKAMGQAVAAADTAVAEGKAFIVSFIDVDADTKATTEAWNAVSAKHPGLCAMFISPDAVKGKVLVYAGVPQECTNKIKAGEWVNAVLKIVNGKGGGKPTTAQGQGTAVDKVDEGVQVGIEFAALKL
eukprot:gene16393-22595_t